MGEAYRCHVCRLELEYSAATDKLVIKTLDADRIAPVDPRVTRPCCSTAQI